MDEEELVIGDLRLAIGITNRKSIITNLFPGQNLHLRQQANASQAANRGCETLSAGVQSQTFLRK
jgi:hypothetical protein